MKKVRWLFLVFLLMLVVNVWFRVWEKSHQDLQVSFLNIGQGDAIFIEAPNGNQMLIDGGPGRLVLRELGSVMPWYDKFIDVVVATHPDADHIGGLPFVLERYQVGLVMEPGVTSDTNTYEYFVRETEEEVKEGGARNLLARRGMNIILDDKVSFLVLYPESDVSGMKTNEASIVGQLRYGSTTFLFTGDASSTVEQYLVQKNGDQLKSNILKAGHHGSRTSTSQVFLDVVDPDYVVVSAGEDNRYGHPHDEVVRRIQNSGAAVLSTATEGRIEFIVD